MKPLVVALALGAVLMMGMFGFTFADRDIDLRERLLDCSDGAGGPLITNLQGEIIEVAKDGLSFKLDSGQWISVTEETNLGLCGACANNDSFASAFTVGNQITGYALDIDDDYIEAFAIYTNTK